MDVIRVAIPYTIYFALMFFTTFFVANGWTKAMRNQQLWHLLPAVMISNWPLQWLLPFSHKFSAAFATVIGPLVEVPVLILW